MPCSNLTTCVLVKRADCSTLRFSPETISAGLWLVLVAISPATSVFDRKPPQTICFALQSSALTLNQQPLSIQQTAYLKPSNFLTSYVFHCLDLIVLYKRFDLCKHDCSASNSYIVSSLTPFWLMLFVSL